MWFRRRADGDFQAEIESHIQLETDRLMAEGVPPAEAHTAARRTFGNAAAAQERFHESQRWLWWEQLRQDLRYGFRSLRKSPSFTTAAALTIALGVGANTAVFSLMDSVLLQLLPVRNPNELFFLRASGTEGPDSPPPYPCLIRLRAETGSFAGMAAFASDELRIEIDGKPEQVMGQVASGNYFEVLGVKAAIGRLTSAEDEALNPPIAVISDRYWRRRFGGDPTVVGKTFAFGSRTFTIAGVTPPEFWGLQPGSPIDITLPITAAGKHLSDSGDWWLHGIVARLKPGFSQNRALAEANVIFRSFMMDSPLPAEFVRKRFHHLELEPASRGMDDLRRRFSKPLYALMGIVGLVLLLASTNVANLLLARGIARQREFAVRLATGAGRMRLVRQLLTETLLLFLLGAIPGVLLARWCVVIMQGFFSQGRRAITLEAQLNWHVLAFSLLATLLAGLLSGLFPAWRAFRTDPEQAIKEGQTRASGSHRTVFLTRSLVAFQVAMSLVLVVGSILFARTLANLRNVDLGFQNDRVLTMSLGLPQEYQRAGKPGAVWNQALEAVRVIPGIRSASISILLPLLGRDRGSLVRISGYEPPTFDDSVIHVNQVSEGYFETLGIPLLRGRPLTARDADGTSRVALINEAAARKFFAERDPIGRILEFGKGGTADSVYRIVGVVRNTKHMNLREAPPPFAFIPIRQLKDVEHRVTLAVAPLTPERPVAFLEAIRKKVAAVDPEILVSDVITIQSQLDSTLLTERLLSRLSSVFGGLALILAAIGLYGLLNYSVGQQRQSLGIRMALGASPSSIAASVMRQSALVVAAGLLVGLPGAFFAARTAESMLWDVKSNDPTLYIAGAGLLCLAGLVSAWIPARRAAGIQPAEALRHG